MQALPWKCTSTAAKLNGNQNCYLVNFKNGWCFIYLFVYLRPQLQTSLVAGNLFTGLNDTLLQNAAAVSSQQTSNNSHVYEREMEDQKSPAPPPPSPEGLDRSRYQQVIDIPTSVLEEPLAENELLYPPSVDNGPSSSLQVSVGNRSDTEINRTLPTGERSTQLTQANTDNLANDQALRTDETTEKDASQLPEPAKPNLSNQFSDSEVQLPAVEEVELAGEPDTAAQSAPLETIYGVSMASDGRDPLGAMPDDEKDSELER